MTEDLPFVCPRCGKHIAYERVKDHDPTIAVHNELVWHIECWNAFLDDHDVEGSTDGLPGPG